MNHAGTPDHLIEIHQVLAELSYPAQRWQVIAEAHYYGAGSACLARLIQLPVRSYGDIDEITGELLGGSKRGRRTARSTGRQSQRPAA